MNILTIQFCKTSDIEGQQNISVFVRFETLSAVSLKIADLLCDVTSYNL